MAAGRFAARRWSLLSICALLISADQKNMTAESGQNVTLTCRAPNNNNNNNNKTIVGVEWSRADLKEEYVLLYRDDFELYKQHPAFKSRVDLQDSQMKDGDVSLILKNVTTADSGRYEARVKTGKTFRKRAYLGSDPFCTFNLRVVPRGPTGGDKEDGGKEDGGKKDGGEDGGARRAHLPLLVPLYIKCTT